MFAIATILATLTTAADLRMAAWEGFHEGEDFCVTGIVTGVIEQDHNYAFADDTGFCYAKMTNGPALRPGDVAALSGKIEINERNWQNAFIRSAEVIGRRQPPPAIDITADRLNDSEYDSRPVRLCGIVADVIPDDIDPR